MHWCMDETLAVLAMIPFIGYFFGKLHAWWHKHFHHKCHEENCYDTHVEHCHMPAHIPHGKPGEGQCEQHPIIIHDEGPEPEHAVSNIRSPFHELEYPWDPISQEDVEERFGRELINDLKFTLQNTRNFRYTDDMEIVWFVNDLQELKVETQGRSFVHDYACCEHGWDEVC